MSQELKQSTACTIPIGPFLDSADGVTKETGLTISQADVRLSKNGANIAQKNESTSATHDELGVYACPLDATDTGTLGRLRVEVHESGALPWWQDFSVITAEEWDRKYGAKAVDIKTELAAILEDTATTLLTAMPTAIKAMTGLTEGGTWTFAKLIEVMFAMYAGKWQLKSGSETVLEILDPEDDATVIAEYTRSPTSPYQQVDIKI